MTNPRRIVSSALFLTGVLLVLFGFSTALGLTVGGVLASMAAVAALLYAGAVWFGPSHRGTAQISAAPDAHAPIVFDREGRLLNGPAAGEPVAVLFPEALRAEIASRSAAAISGTGARFACFYQGRTVLMEALPVRGADGAVVCGILLTAHTQAPVTA